MRYDILEFLRAVGRAVWWFVVGDPVIAPPDVVQHRRNICGACIFNDDDQCEKCTCLIRPKTLLLSEKCPIGSWGRGK